MLICFIGIDGCGKTTLTNSIYEKFILKQKKIKRSYGRFVPIFTKMIMVLGRKAFLKENNKSSNYDARLAEKKAAFKKKSTLAHLYVSIIVLEYSIQLLFRIIIPLKLGYTIFADRYVYDTVINDIAIDLDLSSEEVKSILKKFWSYIPKPDITFFIKVPSETAFKRKDDIPSLNYLILRNKYYTNLTSNEIKVIDGTKEPASLMDDVMSRIEKLKD